MMGYYGYGFGYLGWILMVLFWVGIIWLIVWLINQGKKGHSGKTADEILKERYAKGEISKKEFDEIKKEITR
jgi:putative membrane protein